jgi:site-specific DNA-cytosine methylase
MKAVGIHVFAGGFTMGVKRVFDVQCQLETHGFGRESCEEVVGVPFVNDKEAKWPDVAADFAYGNPRCTAFSCMTAGYAEDCHGPFAKQTIDILQLSQYAAGRYPIIIWESVQQAFSKGRPLLDHITEKYFEPKGYRVAHVLMNAASMGNAQNRKRYFFVAYDRDMNFNITPPIINPYYAVTYDAIWNLRNNPLGSLVDHDQYDENSYLNLTPEEWECVPHQPNGWCLNTLARYAYDILPRKYKQTWDLRTSDMPFSMHCPYRLNWLRPSPTLHGSCGRFLHPEQHRPLTIGELSAIMGWGGAIPRGNNPCAQLAKGVVPDAGEWLAKQAEAYLRGDWGADDWESRYDDKKCEWVGRHCEGSLVKTFDLTRYVGHMFNLERYDVKTVQKHRFNLDPNTGKPIRPWGKVAQQSRRNFSDARLGCGIRRPKPNVPAEP